MLYLPKKIICNDQYKSVCLMKMMTQSANSMRELVDFVNRNGIKKEDVVSMMQTKDGTFLLTYFAEG